MRYARFLMLAAAYHPSNHELIEETQSIPAIIPLPSVTNRCSSKAGGVKFASKTDATASEKTCNRLDVADSPAVDSDVFVRIAAQANNGNGLRLRIDDPVFWHASFGAAGSVLS